MKKREEEAKKEEEAKAKDPPKEGDQVPQAPAKVYTLCTLPYDDFLGLLQGDTLHVA